MTPFLQSNLTSIKKLPGASWSYCFPVLVSQEQLRGKALFLVQKWGIIFGTTHRLAGANTGGGEWGAVAKAFSFFVFQLQNFCFLLMSQF